MSTLHTTLMVAFVVGLESGIFSLTSSPHTPLNLIISCGLESTVITIIKEAYNKCYLLLPAFHFSTSLEHFGHLSFGNDNVFNLTDEPEVTEKLFGQQSLQSVRLQTGQLLNLLPKTIFALNKSFSNFPH